MKGFVQREKNLLFINVTVQTLLSYGYPLRLLSVRSLCSLFATYPVN